MNVDALSSVKLNFFLKLCKTEPHKAIRWIIIQMTNWTEVSILCLLCSTLLILPKIRPLFGVAINKKLSTIQNNLSQYNFLNNSWHYSSWIYTFADEQLCTRGAEEPKELAIVKKLVAKWILMFHVHSRFRNQLVCILYYPNILKCYASGYVKLTFCEKIWDLIHGFNLLLMNVSDHIVLLMCKCNIFICFFILKMYTSDGQTIKLANYPLVLMT